MNGVSEALSASATSWRFDPGSFEPACDAMLGMTPHVSSLSREDLDAPRDQAQWRAPYEERETPNVYSRLALGIRNNTYGLSTSSSTWLRHNRGLREHGTQFDQAFIDELVKPDRQGAKVTAGLVDEMIANVDEKLSKQMDAILHSVMSL